MLGYVANTDYDWYSFLRAQPDLDEVNFWQPSGSRVFRAVSPGAPFFFKLKSPRNVIAGFGHFAGFSILPDWLAWDSFEQRNGAPDFATMQERIRRYRRKFGGGLGDAFQIGCLMISVPVFFEPDEWIAQPRGWAANVVSGRTYDLDEGEGRRVWNECLDRLVSREAQHVPLPAVAEERLRYGSPVLVQPRLGQGTFRIAVTDAYQRACAVSGEHSLPVLDVAHIRRYADGGDHVISNGLLLRTDIHRLFDRGYVTVTPDYRFEVSHLLRDEYENGRTYYELQGKRLALPRAAEHKPSSAALQWHNEYVFRS